MCSVFLKIFYQILVVCLRTRPNAVKNPATLCTSHLISSPPDTSQFVANMQPVAMKRIKVLCDPWGTLESAYGPHVCVSLFVRESVGVFVCLTSRIRVVFLSSPHPLTSVIFNLTLSPLLPFFRPENIWNRSAISKNVELTVPCGRTISFLRE